MKIAVSKTGNQLEPRPRFVLSMAGEIKGANMSGNNVEEIRNLIRNGMKTSQIIASNRFSMEEIKNIKSEELEKQKKEERDRLNAEAEKHMEIKKELHHQRFLKRLGIEPDEEAARAKELADAHFAQEQKETEAKEAEEIALKEKAEAEQKAQDQEAIDLAEKEAEANQQQTQ